MRPWSRRTLLKTGLTLAGGALLPGSACSTEEQELSASAQP
ncbi:TPA: twin-arginine translocation signal domain-containing protein, partial [Pseudomonas aeruginosa]|nr:twin-arginine translocation signal domain-containing protein [Pseudomonas aeruginosa]